MNGLHRFEVFLWFSSPTRDLVTLKSRSYPNQYNSNPNLRETKPWSLVMGLHKSHQNLVGSFQNIFLIPEIEMFEIQKRK